MTVEGKNAVLELLKTDKTIEKVLMEKNSQNSLGRIFAECRKANIKVQFVDKRALDNASATKFHQGVIAYTTDFKYSTVSEIIESCKEGEGFIVVCDGIEDVHNLGSILRVCECGGVNGVIIPQNNSASVNESVIRISAGATNHIKVAKVNSVNNAIDELKKNKFWVYGLDADGQSIYKTDLRGNIVLVIGGEDSGVKRLTKEKCDFIISLPLFGEVNSLNASIALGVSVYEAVRQRNGL